MKTALVVVDVQKYFINKYTKFIPQKIAGYIQKNKFDHILFTKFVNNRNTNFYKLLDWKKCLRSPETDIVSPLTKYTDKSNIFEKSGYSIFKSKGLLNFIQKYKITKFYLCGIDTDACILASAYDGFDLGYEMVVLKDLCRSHYGEYYHESAFKIVENNLRIKAE